LSGGAAQLEIEEVSGSGVVRDRRGRGGDRPDDEVVGGNGGVALKLIRWTKVVVVPLGDPVDKAQLATAVDLFHELFSFPA
jgi:hypothetical protein